MTEPPKWLRPREREVLALIAAGHKNIAIARKLGLRPSTIKGYVESILAKLGVESRTAAAVASVARRGVTKGSHQ